MALSESDEANPDHLKLLTEASASFGELVQQVGDDQWQLETVVEGWNVLTLVAHVVIGALHATGSLHGEDMSGLLKADSSVLGANPMTTWRGNAIAELKAFAEPGALERTVDHPIGEISGLTQLGFRMTENVVHGWDLAQSLQLTYDIPDHHALYLLDFWLPLTNLLTGTGHWGTMVVLDGGTMATSAAAPADRLLAALGRQPS